jgi:hypothetical protein
MKRIMKTSRLALRDLRWRALLAAGFALLPQTTVAQQQGPQGVLVTYCLRMAPSNDTWRITNTCSYIVEAALAQPYPDGRPNGSATFQLFPNQSTMQGYAKLAYKLWACAAPAVPLDASTNAAPRSNSSDVRCPKGGSAGVPR